MLEACTRLDNAFDSLSLSCGDGYQAKREYLTVNSPAGERLLRKDILVYRRSQSGNQETYPYVTVQGCIAKPLAGHTHHLKLWSTEELFDLGGIQDPTEELGGNERIANIIFGKSRTKLFIADLENEELSTLDFSHEALTQLLCTRLPLQGNPLTAKVAELCQALSL